MWENNLGTFEKLFSDSDSKPGFVLNFFYQNQGFCSYKKSVEDSKKIVKSPHFLYLTSIRSFFKGTSNIGPYASCS